MATFSLRMRDDLKRKVQQMARQQGVSLNGYINATLAAAVAQEATLTFLGNRRRDADLDALHQRVMKFMRKPRPGREPSQVGGHSPPYLT
jgi:predicted transcriptional regulator